MAHILGLNTPDQVIGYSENMGKQLFADLKSSEEIVNLIRTQGYVKFFEFEALRSDGKRIWLLMNARKNCQLKGESFTIDGFVHDITERKVAEEKLKQTKQKYRQAYNLLQGVLESPKDVLYSLLTKNTDILLSIKPSNTMEQIWGVNIEVGVSMLNYITDPADREKARMNFIRALAGEEFTLVEEYGDSSLNRLWYSNTYSPLKEMKKYNRPTLVLIDITDRKRLRSELPRSSKKAYPDRTVNGWIVVLDRMARFMR
jgi:PAS domain S-box-containing protein